MNRTCPDKARKKNLEEGFGLVEAMIAVLVFAVGIGGVLSMQSSAVRTNDLSRGITEQSALAASLIEQLMSLPYNHADLAAGTHALPNQGRYSLTYTVAQDAMITNTKTIAVTVSWSVRGQQKTVNLTEIKTNAT
jgi:Tfp pilus assembly protein PilV